VNRRRWKIWRGIGKWASRESPLSEEEVRHVTDFSAIPGEEANISVMSLSNAEVEARKGNTLHVIKEIKDQISLMQEEVSKLLEFGYNHLTISSDAHTQQLMILEVGARSLREVRAQGFMSRVMEGTVLEP
jgi:hypothetical protein